MVHALLTKRTTVSYETFFLKTPTSSSHWLGREWRQWNLKWGAASDLESQAESDTSSEVEHFTVAIKLENTTTVQNIMLPYGATLLDLKNIVSENEDVPVDEIHILLRDSDLEDDRQLVRELPLNDMTVLLV